jgi:DNA-binding MarR family transcriptional regulator
MKSRVLAGIALLALIVAAVILFIILTAGNATSDREIPGIGSPDYMLTGSDGTLYLFSGNNISAIGSDGSLKYRFELPDGWSICARWLVYNSRNGGKSLTNGDLIASEDNGTLYVYLKPGDWKSNDELSREWQENPELYENNSTGFYYDQGKVLAIDRDGKEFWTANLGSLMMKNWPNNPLSDAYISARNGLAYIFHDYNETVICANGTVLWNVEDVSDPAAVDEIGNVYVMNAVCPSTLDVIPVQDPYHPDYSWDYRIPGSVVESYYPNGSLSWRQYTIDWTSRQSGSGTLPLYNNGIVYVPSDKSVTAISANGSKLWVKLFNKADYPFTPSDVANASFFGPVHVQPSMLEGGAFRIYERMPFDAQGNLFMQYPLDGLSGVTFYSYMIVVAPDGRELSSEKVRIWDYQIVGDGIAYKSEAAPVWQAIGDSQLDNLQPRILYAYDLVTGQLLWNYTMPVDRRITLTINASNNNSLIPQTEQMMLDNLANFSRNNNVSQDISGGVRGMETFRIYPKNDMVYIEFKLSHYEYPIVFDKSKYVYTGGLYALSTNGTLLWYVPMAPNTETLSASNSTIIYNTWDGKIYSKALGAIAGGVALVSGAYLAFYFFAGTVTRARSRLDKNGNRTGVFRYIAENPGSTLYEIARGTGINRGTVRYHLFILGTNHRIVAHEAGEKFVRYFTNAGSYGDRERTIISLLRRDVTGKVLRIIAEQPGIGSVDIARELGVHESVAHRSIKELLDKGILTREAVGRGYAYMLTDEDQALVIRSVEKMAGHVTSL